MKKKQLPSKREIIPVPAGTAPKQRAVFSDEFKRSAVARMREGKQSATDLAIELGIRRNQLYKWQKQLDEQAPGAPLRSPGRPAAGPVRSCDGRGTGPRVEVPQEAGRLNRLASFRE